MVMALRARTDAIERIMIGALAQTFTPVELEALARMWSTPEARSIQSKMPAYMATYNQAVEPVLKAARAEAATAASSAARVPAPPAAPASSRRAPAPRPGG
jgi:hypothetical protein